MRKQRLTRRITALCLVTLALLLPLTVRSEATYVSLEVNQLVACPDVCHASGCERAGLYDLCEDGTWACFCYKKCTDCGVE